VRLIPLVVGLLVLWITGPVLLDALDDADGLAELIVLGILAVPAAIALVGGLLALRAAGDLFSSKEVTGEIVRLRVAKSEGEATAYFVAIDDGSSDDVRAWAVRSELYAGLEQGQVVTARVTPCLRYVHSIRPAAA
jgi:hypothetical protein